MSGDDDDSVLEIVTDYGPSGAWWRQPLTDRTVLGAAAATTAGAWSGRWPVALVIGVALAAMAGGGPTRAARHRARLLVAGLALLGALRSEHSWQQLAPDALGPVQGWVRLVDDPAPFGQATRVIIEIDGERFEWWIRGRAAQIRAREWRGGEAVAVSGERVALSPERAQRVSWQHVVGAFRHDWAGDVVSGSRIGVASNRVRAAIERGAATLPPADAALFRGLVIGDDRDQPWAMVQRFRESGLSHLTAVSGSNVAFVVAVASPLLRRLRPLLRWMVTVGLIGWFVSLTRFEPSILRAGVMAAISATAFALGRERSPARLLWLAVTVLLVIDPLLVRSVGFQLSVGATAGVVILGPRLAARLTALGPLATPVGITLGAQVGVMLPQLLVFGQLPLMSLPANLLAVPVAGAVMLYGLPAGIVAGVVPPLAAVLMFPCHLGVRWVDTVALLAARAEPGGAVTWCGWIVVAVAVAVVAAKNRGRDDRATAHR